MKKILPCLLLIGIVLYAVWPLFGSRFIPTHDGEYHIIRFSEFYGELAAGHWFPRWAPHLNSGHGLPLFIFHYPFPNYVGSFFHFLGASVVFSVKLTLAVGYISAVCFCFLWLRKRFSIEAASVGSIVFATVPYWFVDMYVRGSVGEVLAIAFLMLCFMAVEYDRKNLLAISLAGMVVSHNISAMMFFPVIFVYAFFRKRIRVESWILAVGLSSYFWLPAFWESRYMTGLNTVNFREHYPDFLQLLSPAWGTGFSQIGVPYGEMSQQIGVAPLFAIIASGMGIWLAILVFFMLPASLFVWEVLRPLQLIQFPWRLLMLVLPLAGYSAAYISEKRKWWVRGALVVFSFLFSFAYMRPVTYEPRNDAYYLMRKEFTDGTSSMGNSFSTIWTGWKQERPTEPKILFYPGWVAWVDGEAVSTQERQGVVDFIVPEGKHDIRMAFTEAPDRYLSDAVSLAALFWLIGSSILTLYAHRYRY